MNAPVELLGMSIGRVVSVNLDYDPLKQRFPVVVDVVIYAQRLGRVRENIPVLGQYALLDANWSLGAVGDHNSARLLCHSQLREPAGGDYASLVRAHQQAIATLATQMSDAALSWVSSRRETCPVERL